MDEPLRIHSIVRILRKSDKAFCGMGFLVGDTYILTCMHVVFDSLSKSRTTKELPQEDVLLDFPGLSPMLQEAVAEIYIGYLCHSNDLKRDIAVLRLKNKEKLKLISSPLLLVNSNTHLPGISCSYFISRNETYYGWGDGVIQESVLLGRVQINQMLSGSGKLIELGFSGTPVWVNHMNGVIGMIDQVIPDEGVATFIPNNIIMECLPPNIQMEVIPGYLRKIKSPKLPPDYIKREKIIAQVTSILTSKANYKVANLIVIVGPSGSGKTHSALDVFYNYRRPKQWFDCKEILQKSDLFGSIFNVEEDHLIVIDNVVREHPIYIDRWLKEICCNVVVITCEDVVAEDLCLQVYQTTNKQNIIRSTGFDLIESKFYFRTGIPNSLISDGEIEKLFKITHGMPLLMAFLKTIILEEKQIIEDENRFNLFRKSPQSTKKYLLKNEFSIAEVKRILVDKWIKKLDETSKVVLGILSFVPIVGMSTDALLQTYKANPKHLLEAITTLCNIGFVQLRFKGTLQRDNLLIIHDLIKELVIENRSLYNPTYIETYISYLEVTSNYSISEDSDLISKVDILMLQMKLLFQKVHSGIITSDTLFFEMKIINESINKFVPYDIGNPLTSEWISKFFEKVISTAECSLLISLGQSVFNFKANALMASTIWQGAYNYDSWARACCIHAAISHWKRIGNAHLTVAQSLLNLWMHEYLKDPNRYSENKGQNKYYDNQIDLDVATVLGGLCYLGFEDEAIQYLSSSEFNDLHACTVASDLVVIIYLVSHNNERDNRKKNKAIKLIERYFSRVSNSSVLLLTDTFLENKGYKCQRHLGQKKILTATKFGATIACAAYSQEFRQFSYDNGDTSSMIGGITPDRL